MKKPTIISIITWILIILMITLSIILTIKAEEIVINRDVPVNIRIDNNNQLTISYDKDNVTTLAVNTAATQNLTTSFTIQNRDSIANITYCDISKYTNQVMQALEEQNCTTQRMQEIFSKRLIDEREYFTANIESAIIPSLEENKKLNEDYSLCRIEKEKVTVEESQKSVQVSQMRTQIEELNKQNNNMYWLTVILILITGALLLVVFTRGNIRWRLKMPGSNYN